ncbi:hypothetical protein ACJX0J_006642, partial [Zea mays]
IPLSWREEMRFLIGLNAAQAAILSMHVSATFFFFKIIRTCHVCIDTTMPLHFNPEKMI